MSDGMRDELEAARRVAQALDWSLLPSEDLLRQARRRLRVLMREKEGVEAIIEFLETSGDDPFWASNEE